MPSSRSVARLGSPYARTPALSPWSRATAASPSRAKATLARSPFGSPVSAPAWKTRPSWYLVATEDRTIPPPAQRLMSARAGSTVIEVPASHALYISQPDAAAALIEMAAKAIAATPVS